MENETNRITNKKKTIIIGLSLLAILIAGVLAWRLWFAPAKNAGGSYVDPNASAWDDQVAAPTAVSGSIQIPGYTTATMNRGDGELALRIGNPEGNACYLQATLKLEDGTELYETGLMAPGTGYETVPISQALAPGEYNALVHYQGYTMDDQRSPLNGADSALTLIVSE
ncbi:hypothetical protein [Eubacterium sp.]|uniref:hypothetical protein n=1 Tax=Eubacterium sp. TaxID=142586 RepID=UPI002FCA21E9